MKTLGLQKYSASNMKILRNKQVGFFLKAELSHLILIHSTALLSYDFPNYEIKKTFYVYCVRLTTHAHTLLHTDIREIAQRTHSMETFISKIASIGY